MDERRAIVAVILIFVLLFGYNFFVRRQADQAPPEPGGGAQVEEVAEAPAGDVGAESASGETPAAGAGVEPRADAGAIESDEPGSEPAEVIAEEVLTVEGPLWTAALSNRGASIVSWRLAEYQDQNGLDVELVPAGERGLDLGIQYGPGGIRTGDWMFETLSRGTVSLREGGPPATVRYETTSDQGVSVVREYTFYPDEYTFDLAVSVGGLVEPTAQRAVVIGWPGILPTEAKEDNRSLASVAKIDEDVQRLDFGKLRKDPLRRRVGEVLWATSQSRYFMAALMPEEPFDALEVFADVDRRTVGFAATLSTQSAETTTRLSVFAGPQDYLLISNMGSGLERAVDLGWSITRPLSVLMLRALVWAHGIIPNYGIVIILFSILTKLLFYRLTHKSFTEMKRMQDLQPKLEELKKKYEGDREALAKEQMKMYKTEGVNPLGGCLPMLFQMPVFIALFQVLRTTIELRGAPFVLWITDLSQPDTIASIGSLPIHILPILMGVGMLVQQRFSSRDPSQAALGKMMPILFTVLFYNFASGLVLYWLVNTVLSVAQQYYIHRGPSTADGSSSVDAAAPGVQTGQTTASTTTVPDFDVQDAEVVETNPAPPKKRKKKRRKKR
jgi:YidC/Oxa1 family membrane protein insertase